MTQDESTIQSSSWDEIVDGKKSAGELLSLVFILMLILWSLIGGVSQQSYLIGEECQLASINLKTFFSREEKLKVFGLFVLARNDISYDF